MPAAANLATRSSYGVRSESLTRDDDRIATDGLAPPQDVLGDVRRHGVSTQPGVDHRQMSRDVDRVCVGAHLDAPTPGGDQPRQCLVESPRPGLRHGIGDAGPEGRGAPCPGPPVAARAGHPAPRARRPPTGLPLPHRRAPTRLRQPASKECGIQTPAPAPHRQATKSSCRFPAPRRSPGRTAGCRQSQAGHRSLGAPERLTVATGTPSSFQLANAFAGAPAICGSTSWRNSVTSRRSCAAHLYECRTGSCHLGNRMSECVIRLTTMRYGFARRSTPSAASAHPRLAPQVAVVAFRTARRGSNLPLEGAVPRTVVTMVNGGRITDGGRYPS